MPLPVADPVSQSVATGETSSAHGVVRAPSPVTSNAEKKKKAGIPKGGAAAALKGLKHGLNKTGKRPGSKWASLAAAIRMDAASALRRRRNLQPGGIQALQENMKEKQGKARDARLSRKKDLTSVHLYIMDLVAFYLDLTLAQVEDFVLDSPEQLTMMANFMRERGPRAILFYYQNANHLSLEECGRYMPGVRGQQVKRLFVASPSTVALHEKAVYFLKNQAPCPQLTDNNVHTHCSSGLIDLDGSPEEKGAGLMGALGDIMEKVAYPPMLHAEKWGQLLKEPGGKDVRDKCLGDIEKFIVFLSGAQVSVSQAVELKGDSVEDWGDIKTLSDCTFVASNPEKVSQIEKLMMHWCKQLEVVLAESQRMRRETDQTGPRAELDHWRQLSSRFNSLVEQIKGHRCRMVIQILFLAKSKVLATWKALDSQVTDRANEAKDNIKFLYTLEKFCEPLYRTDPEATIAALPNLLRTMYMIHTISNYYRSAESLTTLFVKITNQMVTSCKNYITEYGTVSLWEQPHGALAHKLTMCCRLFEAYTHAYRETRDKAAAEHADSEDGKGVFKFSEMYIFGKFDAFCYRLRQILQIIDIFKAFGPLKVCGIEGIEHIIARVAQVFAWIKKRSYDLLDHRSPFSDDFDEFICSVEEVQNSLQVFMERSFDNAKNVLLSLKLLDKFKRLRLPCLTLDAQLKRILVAFKDQLLYIQDLYEEGKSSPPAARNLPPISGCIAWAMQLYRKIEEPITALKCYTGLFSSAEGREVAMLYNKVAKSLVEFQLLYFNAWAGTLPAVTEALQVTLLRRNAETKELILNLDPILDQSAKECEFLVKAGFSLPEMGHSLLYTRARRKKYSERLRLLLDRNLAVRREIPSVFKAVMQTSLDRVDSRFRMGLTRINWSSLGIEQFCSSVETSLDELAALTKKVKDIKDYHIDSSLAEIGNCLLVTFPAEDSLTLAEFLKSTQVHCEEMAAFIDTKSRTVEQAVYELIQIFCDKAGYASEAASSDPLSRLPSGEMTPLLVEESLHASLINIAEESPEESHLEVVSSAITAMINNYAVTSEKKRKDVFANLADECKELFLYFNHRMFDALLKCCRQSLDAYKRRVFMGVKTALIEMGPTEVMPKGFLSTDMVLEIPNVVMRPGFDEIQTCINKTTHCIIEASRGVAQWGQKRYQERNKYGNLLGLSTRRSDHNGPQRRRSVTAPMVTMEGMVRSVTLMRNSVSQPIPNAPQKMKNYFKTISEHKDVTKMTLMMSSAIYAYKEKVQAALSSASSLSFLWSSDRGQIVSEFAQTDPLLSEYVNEINQVEEYRSQIETVPVSLTVGPLELSGKKLRQAFSVELRAWVTAYCQSLSNVYRAKMDEVFAFCDRQNTVLSRPIKDLDDVRHAMASLEEIRENQIRIEMALAPVEEAYGLLTKYEMAVPTEEQNRCDSLRYVVDKLLVESSKVSDELVLVQPHFKENLLQGIETFRGELSQYEEQYARCGPMEPGIAPREASDRLTVFSGQAEDLWRSYQTYSAGESLFGLPISDYSSLHKNRKEIALLQKLYGLYNLVMRGVDGYYDIVWSEVKIEAINAELQEFQTKCRKLPKGMREWQAYLELKDKIDAFNETIPLLEMMSHKAMQTRHWQRISQLIGRQLDVESENFTLGTVMEANLLRFKEDVEDICISAVKEKDIEAKMKAVIHQWQAQILTFSHFKSRGELLLKGQETAEIMLAMEDSLMILSSLLSNRYNTPYKARIQDWVHKLSETTSVLENWMVVQNLWIYLEAVFVGGDIAKQLPKEAKRFSNIDKSWIKIMTKAHETTNVVECCVGDEILHQLLPHMLEQLEMCQRSLTGYLEAKRKVFPRFFFVSDPALLEILGQASDSHTIQAHLLNIFENISRVEFHAKDYDKILSVKSKEDEVIPLERPLNCASTNVEIWLGSLLKLTQTSLHGVIREAHFVLAQENCQILEFLDGYVAQVGLLGLQMVWTRDSEEALKEARLDRRAMTVTNQKFLDLLNLLIDQTTKSLSKHERVKYETFITIHVHQRDIFDDLTKMHVKSPTDFEWLKQSRFYFRKDDDKTVVSITDVDFLYQNEFLGCTDRLVITPLTDRCYITLAQALGMSMGGSPAGPAGTGKTESVKDMGKALGKYVVVFNCSDQMDFRGLGRIYKGLAQSGSWGCFDEFNRINLPVLSVAAQQISIVLMAKKERKLQFVFTDGDTVDLNTEFGIFITMNPGYAGRQELPENMKVLFRTVAMMVPDRQIIIRVKLASCGFLENVVLAQKFFTLYKLCEEQLSKQVHYDFGLRNILSVLRTLGAAKRARAGTAAEPEPTTVMRVLRDMNLSKLVDEDEPLFMSLIDDLFPGSNLASAQYGELQSELQAQLREADLVDHPPWNLKVVQLYETQLVRHGMMALGPSGSGKTCCITSLLRAMSAMGLPHREMRMNPKAITAPQMFGRLDAATNDWTDGIFSTLWRRTLKAKKGDHVWLILDGPVDAIWVENLNSVLDDNKTLTLANGDRIPMSPTAKIIFEVHNIDNASPATVSRNGMVFMSSSVLDWRPILQGWLLRRPPAEGPIISQLFESVFDDACELWEQSLEPKMPVLQCMIIRQACDLLAGLIMWTAGEGGAHCQSSTFPLTSAATTPALPAQWLERLFVFSIMWSFGALLEADGRAKLQAFLQSHQSKLSLPETSEHRASVFEYLVSRTTGEWEHWSEHVERFEYPVAGPSPSFHSLLVPNVDNVRTQFLVDCMASQRRSVLLIGEQGSAKTVMAKGYMNRYDPESHLARNVNFSSATIPSMFQRTMESYVEKRVGSTYGPPGGRKMTIFIDDINMPVINTWGDQITNEAVRQLMEMGGLYNLDKPGEFSTFVDIQFLAAMIHPGGGRNDIPQRLKRQFAIFNCTLPSNASVDKIFGSIASGYYTLKRGFAQEVIDLAAQLVPITRTVWQSTKVKMLPTPAKFHYIFNLRDLSRIWEGMLKVASPECASRFTLLQLWKHEVLRVISDRFTNVQDRRWFNELVQRTVTSELGAQEASATSPDNYFVDFLRDPDEGGDEGIASTIELDLDIPHVYELCPSLEGLRARLQYHMGQYNETVRGGRLDLVLFRDALLHLVKVTRIISTPRGSAMLVGVGGSGKQSLCRLASFIEGYTTFQITLSRSYNSSNLLEDLKGLYMVAGSHGKGVTFIFTDNEIKDESFMEIVNNVLSSGEVPGLFAREELDEICNDLVATMKKEYPRRPPTMENLYDYFISRVRSNLHIVLCFSPVGVKFRARALKFPGLISGCTMDWFDRWPKDALIGVSEHFLSPFSIVSTDRCKQELITVMGDVHDGVAQTCESYFERFRRRTHVTPKSYLSFIEGYKTIYGRKMAEFSELVHRMDTGLAKLTEATEAVDKLSHELVAKEADLEEANVKADVVLTEVTASQQAAAKVKAAVQSVKDKAQSIVNAIAMDKGVAEKKLEAARPALEEAAAALQTIKPAHIATVKKLGKPPHLIMRIMDCVLLLFQKRLDPLQVDMDRGCPKPSWTESLKMMGSGNFLQKLLDFPKDTINGETVELLSVYLDMSDYNLEQAKRVCGDVAGLASWTKAMAFFYKINREVLPLKANLVKAEGRLGTAQTELNIAQEKLDEKQRELDKVQAVYDAAVSKKQELMEDAEKCKNKMNIASTLINGLSGEKVRWTIQSRSLKEQKDRLVGDVLLLTGFLSYCGPFNQEYRQKLMKAWKRELGEKRIPFSMDLNVTNMLVDPTTVGEWNLQGLPNDDLSTQNGIICTNATRYPLLVDPQAQGKNWIKSRERDNSLQVTSLNHKYFRTHLEDCLSLGQPLLIEDIEEELDPALDNILDKNYVKVGTQRKVKVTDKECDLQEGFYLYMTTKLANPGYSPEVNARTAIIDFTVTEQGLEEQLLSLVIVHEKGELERERLRLLEAVTANKRRMEQLEENLLLKLTTTKGSLVEDESLVEVLATTRVTAAEVSEKLSVAADTEVQINGAREEFRQVALRGSILYFVIMDVSMVSPMYQTSLRQFLELFDQSMKAAHPSPITAKRVNGIINELTLRVFRYISRGLYEIHKTLFTLLLALKIDLKRGHIRHDEFDTLIKGGAALDMNAVVPKPGRWILDETWLNIVQLSNKLGEFRGLVEQVTNNEKQWKHWFEKECPEVEATPEGYHHSLDPFRRLLLIRSWCPDRTIPQAKKYIASSLGPVFAKPVILNMEQTWGESGPHTPLIGLLSTGSDPTTLIETLAKRLHIDCQVISMGQGQEVYARRLVANSMQNGGWVLLQNCHLGLEYMVEVSEVLTQAVTSTSGRPHSTAPSSNRRPTSAAGDRSAIPTHPSFRLWITTEVVASFPISLLQMAIKFTNEPPHGIKAGLKRTYHNITQDQLDVTNMFQWKPLLYTISFLHSVVQERRKYGALGWNIPYEFNSSDWLATVQFFQNHLDDMDIKKGVQWSTIRYMIGEVQYGGRVTDDRDKRLLATFARVWFSEATLGDAFQFYKGYGIPSRQGKLEDIMEFIEALPATDSPEAFGLHHNADITYQNIRTRDVLETILSIQPKDSSGGDGDAGETRESVVYKLAADMLDKLPPDYVPHDTRQCLKKMAGGPLQPLTIFLKQEVDRMQKVIAEVRLTLVDIQLAIDGTIVMNERLREVLDSTYDAHVPASWAQLSWQSSSLGFWFTELVERNAQLSQWLQHGRPRAFWMTGFFNPQGFLTAMRQEVTRAHKGWALDGVTLHNDVLRLHKEDVVNAPSEGVYVYGLYLDGCGWDRRNCRLCEPPAKVLFTPLPVVHIYAVNVLPKETRPYHCPVYKKACRTDLTYITTLALKTNQSPDYWILRGVAALCDIK